MSQNNQIRKSDKKFIRLQKAKIRSTVLDVKKQEELINELYKKFEAKAPVISQTQVESKTEEVKTQKAKVKNSNQKSKLNKPKKDES